MSNSIDYDEVDYTREDVFAFLDAIRDSGLINPLASNGSLVHNFGMSKRQATTCIKEWVAWYDQRTKLENALLNRWL